MIALYLLEQKRVIFGFYDEKYIRIVNLNNQCDGRAIIYT